MKPLKSYKVGADAPNEDDVVDRSSDGGQPVEYYLPSACLIQTTTY